MIRPKKAYAIVNKNKPIINIQDIYKDKDVRLRKNEIFVRVVISVEK